MEKNNLTIPAAIVVAGVLIAGALFVSRGGTPDQVLPATDQLPQEKEVVIQPVTSTDHILGNPNAKIKIVEYSDTECPYCKQFHVTMHKIMDDYGKDAEVAWVYRHFPLYKPGANGRALHSNAGKQAEATECVNELGGPTKFWQYLDKIYEVTPSNNGLDMALLPEMAAQLGIDKTAFNTCLNSGKYAEAISKAYADALAAGATGTPYNIILTADGQKIPVNGAQPYESVKTVIETILKADTTQ